jgi:hypothetical protein
MILRATASFPSGCGSDAAAAEVPPASAFFAVCRRQPPTIAEPRKAPASKGLSLSRLRARPMGINFILDVAGLLPECKAIARRLAASRILATT